MTGLLLLAGAILSESFEDGGLDRWRIETGATAGDSPSSEARVEDGALRFEGSAETRRWVAVMREADLAGASWVRISARVRTEDVNAAGARFVNCNVLFRFGTGPIQISRMLTGTNDWTRVARRVPVPEGATSILVGCFLSMPGRAWFDDVQVEAVDAPRWESAETEHYSYRWLEEVVSSRSQEFNEESYRIVAEFLGVPDGPRVTFLRYSDLDAIEEFTGFRGNQFRQGSVVHSIWETDRHEVVHVLADAWGDPPAILGEGLAVHLSGAWQGRPVREAAAEVEWIPLEDILDSAGFRARPDATTYPESGALVAWLLETRGTDLVRQLYGRLSNRTSHDDNLRAWEEVTGAPLSDADAAVRAWLAESP